MCSMYAARRLGLHYNPTLCATCAYVTPITRSAREIVALRSTKLWLSQSPFKAKSPSEEPRCFLMLSLYRFAPGRTLSWTWY